MDYCLTTDGLVRFQDRIYVPDRSEVKKLILREFHEKLYSSHLGYQKTLTTVEIFLLDEFEEGCSRVCGEVFQFPTS